MYVFSKFRAAAMYVLRRGEEFLQRSNKRCRIFRRGDYVILPRREKLAAARKLCRRGEIMFKKMHALGKFLAAAMLILSRGEDFLHRLGKRCRIPRCDEV